MNCWIVIVFIYDTGVEQSMVLAKEASLRNYSSFDATMKLFMSLDFMLITERGVRQ